MLVAESRFCIISDGNGVFRSIAICSKDTPSVSSGDHGFLWLDTSDEANLALKMWDEPSETWLSVASGGGGGSGAPTDAQYLVLALNGDLTAERLFAVATPLADSDGGAGGTYTVSLDIEGLAEETSPGSTDWLLMEVNAGGTFNKVKFSNLPAGTESDELAIRRSWFGI